MKPLSANEIAEFNALADTVGSSSKLLRLLSRLGKEQWLFIGKILSVVGAPYDFMMMYLGFWDWPDGYNFGRVIALCVELTAFLSWTLVVVSRGIEKRFSSHPHRPPPEDSGGHRVRTTC